jgi:hypothetical protein
MLVVGMCPSLLGLAGSLRARATKSEGVPLLWIEKYG